MTDVFSSYHQSVPAGRPNSHYPSARAPLAASPLAKLPLGAIRPLGWLRQQLDLMLEGLTGRLSEISKHLKDDNGWLDPKGSGWEEAPYWFRGFSDLAILTGDKRCRHEANRYVEAAIASQHQDGYFGPTSLKEVSGKDGRVVCDLWPHMVMLEGLLRYHEYCGDTRIITLAGRFFEFCLSLPDDRFIPEDSAGNKGWGGSTFGTITPFIQYTRAGDLLPSIYWLFNRTGEQRLLDLAVRVFHKIRPAWDEWLDHHAVNFPERFAYATLFSPQSQDPAHRAAAEYWYTQHMATWGQMPRGVFAADERIRPGCIDPRQAFETCGMVEFARSFYLLSQVTGEPVWADCCEDVMLNHFPATHTADLKAVHYLTACNQPQLDANGGHLYRNGTLKPGAPSQSFIAYTQQNRCCGHNAGMGWPSYAQHLLFATSDDGVAIWMHAECDATVRVGSIGAEVGLEVRTDFPFSETTQITVRASNSVEFPLYVRIPTWCVSANVSVNGRQVDVEAPGGGLVRIVKDWREGDQVSVRMPMEIGVTRWPRNGSATVEYGPLSFSVQIAEKQNSVCAPVNGRSYTELLPESSWNYGLVLDHPMKVLKSDSIPAQPWVSDRAPLKIIVGAKQIPDWGLQNDTVTPLQDSPIHSDEPVEEVTMIPLGCARLRMSCLPVIGTKPLARTWRRQPIAVDPYKTPRNRFDAGEVNFEDA